MNGLNKQQIEYRINNNLINNQNIKNSRTIKEIFYSNIITLFNAIHLILFIMVLTTGSITNTAFILSITVNTIIGIYQEIKAKKIIDNLKITNIDKITVIREGKPKKILPTEILLGDLLALKSGDTLPVDAIIVTADNCEVDESIITGESNSITKQKNDKLISGSIILCGSCYAEVTSINRDTYANNLIKEASQFKHDSSYLKNSINSILKVITIIIIPVGLMLFITQFFYSGQTYSESILSSVAGVIGMIPDGLVLLTSISLTVGVIKMASKKVIIQKLNGIELLACVDILCLDKTGTITDGTMKVIDFIKIAEQNNINEIISNMLNNPVNATDKALIKYFGTKNNFKVINKLPFSSNRKYTKVKFDCGEFALGALEYITNKKTSDFKCLEKHINNGYRILTLVKCKKEFDIKSNEILAFIILKDNIRKNAKETLEYFKKQNVKLKIISGDNPQTVFNLMKQIGFDDTEKYISGTELPTDKDKLRSIVDEYSIFGRVTPYQKQTIINILRQKKTVGMIGDGVNDILALKEADCGIALANGISAARSVSEVVLTDSDFNILPEIVNEGRRVVNNIERVASMYLIKTTYSFVISLICIIFAHEYPFYPIQLTLIGVVCVGIPSFFIALEPNYNKVTKRFIIKVFKNALPSGVCVSLTVFIIIIITKIFKVEFEPFRMIIVATTGYLNLRLLYKVSIPLTLKRKILLYTCFISYYGILLLFFDFFLLQKYNIITIILIGICILISNYITNIFEKIYDKIFKFKKE